MREVTVHIPAMHCAGCVNTVRMVLRPVQGAEVLGSDAGAKLITLGLEDTAARDRAFAALDAIGYTPAQAPPESQG